MLTIILSFLSLVLLYAWFIRVFILACLPHPVCSLPALDFSLSWIIPFPCCFWLCLHLVWTISCLWIPRLPRPLDYVHRRLTHSCLWNTILSCLCYTYFCWPMPVLWPRLWIKLCRWMSPVTSCLLHPDILGQFFGIPDCFDHVDWDMFRAASDDDIEAYSDTVTCFIRKCIEDVVPTKTICIYPNQKPWINSDVRSALSARTSAFKSGNTDDRKQASYDRRRSIKAAKQQYKNKVEE